MPRACWASRATSPTASVPPRRSNAWRSTTRSPSCPTGACCSTACSAWCSAASAPTSTAPLVHRPGQLQGPPTTPWADVGDQLLTQVAERLVRSVRECDTVARFGGDEFVILLEGLTPTPTTPPARPKPWPASCSWPQHPFELAGQQHYSTPSIGLTLFGQERQGVDELLKRADLAMYEAKAAGRNTHRFFDPGMQQAPHERSSLEADLRQACSAANSMCTTRPSSTTRATSRAPAWRAGTTPERRRHSADRIHPLWPNRPASSCRWASTSCTPPASSSCAGRSPGDRPPKRGRQRQRPAISPTRFCRAGAAHPARDRRQPEAPETRADRKPAAGRHRRTP